MLIVLGSAGTGKNKMDNKDKEYAQERQEGKNWAEKASLPSGGLEARMKEAAERIPSVEAQFKSGPYKGVSHGDGYKELYGVDSLELERYNVAAVMKLDSFADGYGSSNRRILEVHYAEKGKEQKPAVLYKEFWKCFYPKRGEYFGNPKVDVYAQSVYLKKEDESKVVAEIVNSEEGKVAKKFKVNLAMGRFEED